MPVETGFWPTAIKPKIQTPLAILRARAHELDDVTKGVLIGKVSSMTEEAGAHAYHSLDAIVPALNGLRQRLFTVRHALDRVYPAFLDITGFEFTLSEELAWADKSRTTAGKRECRASTDDELLNLLREVVRTSYIQSVLISLIALATEPTDDTDRSNYRAGATGVVGDEGRGPGS